MENGQFSIVKIKIMRLMHMGKVTHDFFVGFALSVPPLMNGFTLNKLYVGGRGGLFINYW